MTEILPEDVIATFDEFDLEQLRQIQSFLLESITEQMLASVDPDDIISVMQEKELPKEPVIVSGSLITVSNIRDTGTETHECTMPILSIPGTTDDVYAWQETEILLASSPQNKTGKRRFSLQANSAIEGLKVFYLRSKKVKNKASGGHHHRMVSLSAWEVKSGELVPFSCKGRSLPIPPDNDPWGHGPL